MKSKFERILNHDCKLHIFENFKLRTLLRLRFICRSWNELICEILLRKDSLRLFQGRHQIIGRMYFDFYDHRQVIPFFRFENCVEDDDLIYLSYYTLYHNRQKYAMFARFLSTRMPNITKFMFVSEWLPRLDGLEAIMNALPCLETFFFYITDEENGWAEAAQTIRVIPRRLKELFLYLDTKPVSQRDRPDPRYHPGSLLKGLTTLHLVDDHPLKLIRPNTSIKELWIEDYFEFSSLKAVPNLEILQLNKILFSPANMQMLNTLTKLEQLNCRKVEIDPEVRPEEVNRTVTHLQLISELKEEELPDLLNSLPTILRWLGALERLTIHHNLNQKQLESIRVCLPTRIAVNFVEYDLKRFMGKFVHPGGRYLLSRWVPRSRCFCWGRCKHYWPDILRKRKSSQMS